MTPAPRGRLHVGDRLTGCCAATSAGFALRRADAQNPLMSVAHQKMTAAEFLEWDARQSTRHEFFDGEVFAMAGASQSHVTVVLNVGAELRAALRGKACRPFVSDMKVHVRAERAYFYPDVFVTCAEGDLKAAAVMERPTVIFEVLSASTAAIDRGDKFRTYRRIAEFREYVLIDPESKRVEVFRRVGDSAKWTLTELSPGSALELESLGVSLEWSAVFENVG